MMAAYRVKDLTAETTSEELMAPVRKVHEEMIGKMTSNLEAGGTVEAAGLNGYVMNIAKLEGQASVAQRFVHLLSRTTPVKAALQLVLTDSAKRPDDSWSGRGNEVARVRFEGEKIMMEALADRFLSFNDDLAAAVEGL